MLSSISNFQKKIWNKFNIRLVILFSLFLQIFLIISAPTRKRTRSFFVSFVWLAYLLADWAAGYCIGLISNNQEQKSSLSQNDYLMAFWGPFLLLHLGGPDTITAFALEDNELWLRHLFGLIFQSVMTGYIFLLTIPHNATLWLPTILMFAAGLTKYAERTHALYLAAVNNFKKSLLQDRDPGPNYAKLMEEYSSKINARLPADILVIPEVNHQGSNKNDSRISNIEKEEDHLELVRKAFIFFEKFRGVIVDMIYSFKDRLESQECFKNKKPEEALELIEIELNFMYEFFYTKASVIREYRIWFWGKFATLMFIIAALVVFIEVEKHGFNELDVKVTYVLLSGAIFLDVMALVKRLFTDYTATLSDDSSIDSDTASYYQKIKIRVFKFLNQRFLTWFLRLKKPTWSKINEDPYKDCKKLSTKFLFRRWSGSIPGYNLLKYCLDESIPRVPKQGSFRSDRFIPQVCFRIKVFVQDTFYRRDNMKCHFKDFLDQLRYQSSNPFLQELWIYIFNKLKKKSDDAKDIEAIQSICSARGERVIQKEIQKDNPNREKLESLKPFVDPNEVSFDESLLLWHIATSLCYTTEEATSLKGREREISTADEEAPSLKRHEREISTLLSDYMLYLLIMQPNMMSAIAGIGQKRFQDTCEEAKMFFKKRVTSPKGDRKTTLEEALGILTKVPTNLKPVDVKGDRSKSVLFDACCLAKALQEIKRDKKWEIISSVWVELLCYAACHCRPTGHVQLLSKGGELISFVWLLMLHLGLGTQFQIKEGDARAKLIVW